MLCIMYLHISMSIPVLSSQASSSTHVQTSRTRTVACQTDPIVTHTASTQKSWKKKLFKSECMYFPLSVGHSYCSFKNGTSLFLTYCFSSSQKCIQKYRSVSDVQATVHMCDWEGGTSNENPLGLSSTPVKRPAKRPRLELEEELEDPFEGTSSTLSAPMEQDDSTYDPANYTAATLDSTIQG